MSKDTESYTIEDVRTLVTAAATILKKIGTKEERSENERVAWMLEDTLSYIDEMKVDDGLNSSKAAIEYLENLEGDKAVNI